LLSLYRTLEELHYSVSFEKGKQIQIAVEIIKKKLLQQCICSNNAFIPTMKVKHLDAHIGLNI
jgi:hypothetical protein